MMSSGGEPKIYIFAVSHHIYSYMVALATAFFPELILIGVLLGFIWTSSLSMLCFWFFVWNDL